MDEVIVRHKAAVYWTAAFALENIARKLRLNDDDCLLCGAYVRVYTIPSKGRKLFKDRYIVLWYSAYSAHHYGSTNYQEAISIATTMLEIDAEIDAEMEIDI